MSLNNFNKVLSWNDFIKVSSRPPGKPEDAVISVSWTIDADFGRQGSAIVVAKYSVNIFLVDQDCSVLSSTATGPKSAELLKHEQGHFDIVALGAREFHDKVARLSAPTEDELNAKIKELREKLTEKSDTVDGRYDTATNHSINTTVQQTWDQKIDAAKKNPKGTVDDLP